MPVTARPAAVKVGDLIEMVGHTLARGPWLTIEQDMIDRFARAVGTRRWATDQERQTVGQHGGNFVLSMIPTLCRTQMQVVGVRMSINYGVGHCRFPESVGVGSTIRARTEIVGVDARADGSTLLTRRVVVEIKGRQRAACVAELLRLYEPIIAGPAEVVGARTPESYEEKL